MRNDDHLPTSDIEWLSVEAGKKKSRTLTVFFVVIGSFFALLTIILFVSVVIRRVRALDRDVEVTGFRTSAQLHRETVKAYQDYEASPDTLPGIGQDQATERQAIEHLLEGLQSCSAADDDEKFKELVDFDRVLKRVELTGALLGYSTIDQRFLRGELRESATVEENWKEMHVVKVLTPRDEPDTRILYVFSRATQYDDLLQFRLLIGWDGEQWKLYDWVRLDLGLWESAEHSVYLKYNGLPTIDGLNRWGELVVEADRLIAEYDYDAAREKLRLAEAQRVPDEIEARCRLLTSFRWQHISDYKEAKRCLLKIKNPEEAPGVYESLVYCNRWNDQKEAIRNAELSEAAVGPTPSMLRIKAALYRRSNQEEKEQEQWKNLLRIEPDDQSALAALLLALPRHKKSELAERLQRVADPQETIAGLAESVIWQDVDSLQFLEGYAQQHFPGSTTASYIRGLLNKQAGGYQEAADEFRRALLAETDEDIRSNYVEAYLDAMTSIGRGFEAFRELPDQESAFESVACAYSEEESQFSREELRQIAEYFCQKNPASFAGYDLLANLVFEQRDYPEAERILRKGLSVQPTTSDPNKADEEESYVGSLKYMLAATLYELDRLEEAYLLGEDRKASFSQLAQRALQRQNWEKLEALIQLRRQDDPEDPEVNRFEAELFVRRQDWEGALSALQRAKPLAEKYRARQIENRICEIHIANDDWTSYYGASEDRDAAFDSLASCFISNKQWTDWQRLVELHGASAEKKAQLWRHRANASWAKKDYPEYVRHATELLESNDGELLPSYVRSRYENHLLTALIKTDRWVEARVLAGSKHAEDDDANLLAIVEAAWGDSLKAKILARQAAEEAEGASRFYTSDVAGEVFLGSEFKTFREEFPVSLPYDFNMLCGVLFAEEPWRLDAETIAAALGNDALDSNVVSRVPAAREGVTDVFIVRIDGGAVWIAAGTGSFFDDVDISKASHPLLIEAGKNNYWLAAGALAMADLQRSEAASVARKMLGGLRGQAKLLIASEVDSWGQMMVFPARDDLMTHWASTGVVPLALGQGLPLYPWQRRYDLLGDREFEMSMRDVIQKHEDAWDSQLTVMAYLVPQLKAGLIQLRVDSITRKYGGLQFEGKLTEPASSMSGFEEGLRFQLDLSRLCGYFRNDETVVFKRDSH